MEQKEVRAYLAGVREGSNEAYKTTRDFIEFLEKRINKFDPKQETLVSIKEFSIILSDLKKQLNDNITIANVIYEIDTAKLSKNKTHEGQA